MRYFLIIMVVVSFFGCSAKVDMTIFSPAKNPYIMEYDTVGVWKVTDDKGTDYTNLFRQALAAVRYNDKNVYNLIPEKQIMKLREEMVENSSENAVKAAKLLDTPLWLGTISYEYSEEPYKDIQNTCVTSEPGGPSDRCGSEVVSCMKQELQVNAEMILITADGLTAFSETISDNVSLNTCQGDKAAMDEKGLKSAATDRIVDRFIKTIAPYQEDIKVEIMSNDKGISDDASKAFFENGIAFAKEKRMDKACVVWAKAFTRNPYSISLSYNLALCKEIEGDYEGALSMLEELDEMLPPAGMSEKFYKTFGIQRLPNELVLEAINRNKKHISDNKIMEETIR